MEKKSSGLRERFNFCNGWNISNTPELYIAAASNRINASNPFMRTTITLEDDVAASLKRLEKRRSVINRVETVSGCPVASEDALRAT